MSELACDRCGRSLLAFEDVRYVVEIRVVAAYDPLELNPVAARETDFERLLADVVAHTEHLDEDELEAQVWKQFRFDLCLRCQREYVRDPMPRRAEE